MKKSLFAVVAAICLALLTACPLISDYGYEGEQDEAHGPLAAGYYVKDYSDDKLIYVLNVGTGESHEAGTPVELTIYQPNYDDSARTLLVSFTGTITHAGDYERQERSWSSRADGDIIRNINGHKDTFTFTEATDHIEGHGLQKESFNGTLCLMYDVFDAINVDSKTSPATYTPAAGTEVRLLPDGDVLSASKLAGYWQMKNPEYVESIKNSGTVSEDTTTTTT